MDLHICVLLYSRYSQMSKKLQSILDDSQVNLSVELGLMPVCIDNEKIRKKISKSEKISIPIVPCILLVYKNGSVEKYDGIDAIQWANETIRKIQQLRQPPPHPPPQQFQEPPRTKKVTIQQEDSEEEEEVQVPKKHVRKQRKSKKPVQKFSELSENEEEQEEHIIARAPVAVRNGPGGYDITSEFGELEEQPRKISSKVRPSSTQQIKGGNLMAAALAMQKERDADAGKRIPGGDPNMR